MIIIISNAENNVITDTIINLQLLSFTVVSPLTVELIVVSSTLAGKPLTAVVVLAQDEVALVVVEVILVVDVVAVILLLSSSLWVT